MPIFAVSLHLSGELSPTGRSKCKARTETFSLGTPAFNGEVVSGFNEYVYSTPFTCSFGSVFTPGPMVEEIVMRLIKLPFAPDGRDLFTASIKAT